MGRLRILGVDPGTNLLGYALMEGAAERISVLDLGVIRMRNTETQEEKLTRIFKGLNQLILEFQPQALAIEAPFYGKNIQSMLKLGRAQGIAIAAALHQGLPFAEYPPKRVKQAITGNGNATKEQVSALLVHLTGNPLTGVPLDASDALAVAVCHYFAQLRPSLHRAGGKSDWAAFLRENPDRLKG